MQGPAKLATTLAAGMVLVGFIVIWGAWSGAAELDQIQRQFPYLLSGGLAGLGLVTVGAAVLVVQVFREASAQEIARLTEVNDGLETVLQALHAADDDAPQVAAKVRKG